MEDQIVDTTEIEQDNEATGPEEALELVEGFLEELGDSLIDGLLLGKLNAINEPLAQEAQEQETRAVTLRESHVQLLPRVAAQQRILAGEIDKALSEGRDDEAEAKRQEGAGLEQNLWEIQAQAEACEHRVRDLEAEQRQNYRRVFESAYPEIRESTVAAEIALCKMLDKVWGRILRYEVESGLQPFVKTKHKSDLTPAEYAPEKPYFISLQKWFGGRR